MDLSPEKADRAAERAAELIGARLRGQDAPMLAAVESLGEAEAKELVVALVTTRAAEIERAGRSPFN